MRRFWNGVRRHWRWIVWGVIAIIVIVMVVSIYNMHTAPIAEEAEEPAKEPEEDAVETPPGPTEVVVVVPVGRTDTHATAFVSVPPTESFIFQWENSNGVIVSDTDGGPTEEGYEGDIEIFLLPEAQKGEIFPVVYFNGERFPGSPLP